MGLKKTLTPSVLASYINPPMNLSFSEIGTKHDVSRQRVHQLYKEYKKNHPDLFVEKTVPGKAELESLLTSCPTLKEVAEKLDMTVNKLKRLMKRYDLKKQFVKEALSHDVLHQLYVVEEKSDDEIGRQFRCSRNTVMKLRYEFGIYESMRKTLADKLTKEIFEELYEQRGVSLHQLASLFGTHIQNIIELKTMYQSTKRRANGVSADDLAAIKSDLEGRNII